MEEQIELIRIDLKQLSNYRQDDFHYAGCTNDILLHLKSAEIQHQNLQKELSKANDKLKKIEEYITSYESISTIQGLNDTKENKNLDKNTMVEMTNRYLKVHDKILSIIKGDEEK